MSDKSQHALFASGLTDKVTVATRAQKKLLHIVLILKTLLISCDVAASVQTAYPPVGLVPR